MAELLRHSALRGASWQAEGLSIVERPFSGKFRLRGRLDAMVVQRLAELIGQALPDCVGSLAGEDPGVALLAPESWLVLAGKDSVAAQLGEAVAGSSMALHDVSDGWTEISVSGALAEELLAGATARDLRLHAFPVGGLAQTQVARADGLIRRTEGQSFSVFVDSSFADYAWLWLTRNGQLVVAAAR